MKTMTESEFVEFPVIIDGSNEVITLFLDKQSAEKAAQGIVYMIVLCIILI